jgi:hypothetical protein
MDAKPARFSLSMNDYQMAGRNLMSLYSLSNNFGQEELANQIMEMIQKHEVGFSGMF